MTITKKDRAFDRKIARRVLAGKKVARKDIQRALDIRFAINRAAKA